MKIIVAINRVPEHDALDEMDRTAPELMDVAQLLAKGLPEPRVLDQRARNLTS